MASVKTIDFEGMSARLKAREPTFDDGFELGWLQGVREVMREVKERNPELYETLKPLSPFWDVDSKPRGEDGESEGAGVLRRIG